MNKKIILLVGVSICFLLAIGLYVRSKNNRDNGASQPEVSAPVPHGSTLNNNGGLPVVPTPAPAAPTPAPPAPAAPTPAPAAPTPAPAAPTPAPAAAVATGFDAKTVVLTSATYGCPKQTFNKVKDGLWQGTSRVLKRGTIKGDDVFKCMSHPDDDFYGGGYFSYFKPDTDRLKFE